jgi:hypothetical protein
MKDDLLPFLIGIMILVLYLVFSAMTEMGTRWPWQKLILPQKKPQTKPLKPY